MTALSNVSTGPSFENEEWNLSLLRFIQRNQMEQSNDQAGFSLPEELL